jgi:hypothetical protein
MVVCAKCGAEGDGKFCGTCGSPLPTRRTLARGAGSPFACRVSGGIPAGSTVTVGERDTFYGLRFGACEVELEKGSHAIADELEGGWFIHSDGVEIAFEEDLGVMEDRKENKAKVVARGTIRVKIDEPRDFIVWQSEDLDVPALSQRVIKKVCQLIEAEIRDMLAGERYLTSLQSSKMVDSIKKDVLSAWTGDSERDTFAAIELPRVEVRVTTITDPPPPSLDQTITDAKPPVPTFEAGGRVDVVWSDGQRYPGTVRATGCLVKFDDGQEHWIPVENLAEPKPPA